MIKDTIRTLRTVCRPLKLVFGQSNKLNKEILFHAVGSNGRYTSKQGELWRSASSLCGKDTFLTIQDKLEETAILQVAKMAILWMCSFKLAFEIR